MKKALIHILPPALLGALFFVVALSPVQVLGCRNRGLTALIVALTSLLAALACTITGAVKKGRGDKNYAWWALSSMLFLVPVVGLIILA